MDVFLVSCAAMLMCVDEPSSASVSVRKLFLYSPLRGRRRRRRRNKMVIAID